jgi:hypothetical protein
MRNGNTPASSARMEGVFTSPPAEGCIGPSSLRELLGILAVVLAVLYALVLGATWEVTGRARGATRDQKFPHRAAVLARRQNASLPLGMLTVSASTTRVLLACGEGGRTLTERLLCYCLLGPEDWTTPNEIESMRLDIYVTAHCQSCQHALHPLEWALLQVFSLRFELTRMHLIMFDVILQLFQRSNADSAHLALQ